MIPTYKMFHGCVLAELIDLAEHTLCIGELSEEGRLAAYTLNDRVGLYVKHSTKRLSPWSFTLTTSNLRDCLSLRETYEEVFLALVCETDGIAVTTLSQLIELVEPNASDQAWLRVSRRPQKSYTLSGNRQGAQLKKAQGVHEIVRFLWP